MPKRKRLRRLEAAVLGSSHALFTAAATAAQRLVFHIQRQPVAQTTTVEPVQTLLQVVAAILSTVAGLIGAVRIVFKVSEKVQGRCGIGGGDFLMARRHGVSVLGIDLSRNMVDIAKQRALEAGGDEANVEFQARGFRLEASGLRSEASGLRSETRGPRPEA